MFYYILHMYVRLPPITSLHYQNNSMCYSLRFDHFKVFLQISADSNVEVEMHFRLALEFDLK